MKLFQIDDYIVYDNRGVCKVLDNNVTKFNSVKTTKIYYKLAPVYDSGVIYIPINTTVFMRSVITRQNAENLIKSLPKIKERVITNKMTSYMEKQYNELLKTHDCETLFQVIKGLHLKQQRKKLGQIEQSFLKRAENLLYGELAIALDIPRESVVSYIEDTIFKMEGIKK